MKTVICVAVRMKSRRCPEKAIKPLYGAPLILRLTERIKKAKLPDKIVWCTSTSKQDDILEQLAIENGIDIYRGSKLDVMSRFLKVADKYGADTLVRVTGDNPLTDPTLIDNMIIAHQSNRDVQYTYTTDTPRGIKPEVISVKTLRFLHSRVDGQKSEYMTDQLKQKTYRQFNFKSNIGFEHRTLTVDTPEDLKRMQNIYTYFHGDPPIKTQKILAFLNDYSKF